MKDLISKLTFGFLMAQFFPGVIVVVSLTSWFIAPGITDNVRLLYLFEEASAIWTESTQRTVVFVLLSIGAGMFIHGVNWAVLAWLENYDDDGDGANLHSVTESFWHNTILIVQLPLMPIKMVGEILLLLIRAPSLDKLTMDENVSRCTSEDVGKFVILHDFYLHFGQFYAHSAYACLVSFGSLAYVVGQWGLTWNRFWFLISLYALTSCLFLIGRIQLGSLFNAEEEICTQKSKSA